jgi:hypothetical protein
VRSGSIEYTRAWLAVQGRALKVLANSRASVPDLTHCIAQLRGYK